MKKILILLLSIPFINLAAQPTFTETYYEYGVDIKDIAELISGDLNGDNIPDFVGSNQSGRDIFVALNNGTDKPDFVKIEDNVLAYNITLHDIDQDDDLDIIGSIAFSDSTFIWTNDGAANFTRDFWPITDYDNIHFANVVGDAREELILGSFDQFNIYDIENGTLTFIKNLTDGSFLGGPSAISSFDYNQDGLIDIVGAFSSNGIRVFQNSPTGDFTQITVINDLFSVVKIDVADQNNDGVFDFLVYRNTQETSIATSQTDGSYDIITLPSDNGANEFSSFGDIDNDGDLDVLFIEKETTSMGTTSFFIYEDGIYTKEIYSSEYSRTETGGINDLNSDGNNDFYILTNDVFDPGLVIFTNQTIIDNDDDGFSADDDCDDENPDINPGQTEIAYNGIDDDCDDTTLDDDIDQDGFNLAQDCDDNNSNINPGLDEIPYNGLDDDCDNTTFDDDLDEDGFNLADDCDDENPNINPDAVDIANNGIDEDCDGMDFLSSTHQFNNGSLDIYPNPTSAIINLEIDGQLLFEATVYSIGGKQML